MALRLKTFCTRRARASKLLNGPINVVANPGNVSGRKPRAARFCVRFAWYAIAEIFGNRPARASCFRPEASFRLSCAKRVARLFLMAMAIASSRLSVTGAALVLAAPGADWGYNPEVDGGRGGGGDPGTCWPCLSLAVLRSGVVERAVGCCSCTAVMP